MAKALVLLARPDQTTAGVPDALEPAEVQNPLHAAPSEIRDVEVAAPVTPDRPREHQVVVPELLRNLLLVLQEVLGLALAEVGVLLLRPLPHLLAGDVVLATLEEGAELELGGGEGFAGNVFDERPAFLRHVAEESGSGRAVEATLDCRLESVAHLLGIERSLLDATEEVPLLPGNHAQGLVCDNMRRHDELLSASGNLLMRSPHSKSL